MYYCVCIYIIFFTRDMCIIYSILCDDLGRIRNQVHPGPDQLHMARKAWASCHACILQLSTPPTPRISELIDSVDDDLTCWGAIDLLKMTLHFSYMRMVSFFFQKQLLFDFFTCIILEGGNFDTPSQIVWNHLNPCIFGQAFAGPRAATGISTYRGNVGLVWDR